MAIPVRPTRPCERTDLPRSGEASNRQGQPSEGRTAELASVCSRWRRLPAALRPAHGLPCGAGAPFSAAAGRRLPEVLPDREVLRQSRVRALRSSDRPRRPGRVKTASGVARDGASASTRPADQQSKTAATTARSSDEFTTPGRLPSTFAPCLALAQGGRSRQRVLGPRGGGEVSAGTPERRGYASSSKPYSSHDARDHSTRPTTMEVRGRRGAP
jgi:hypothetical protein